MDNIRRRKRLSKTDCYRSSKPHSLKAMKQNYVETETMHRTTSSSKLSLITPGNSFYLFLLPLNLILTLYLMNEFNSEISSFTCTSKPQGEHKEEAIITIPNLGVIRGVVEETATTQRKYLSFSGVPYGVIRERFAPAVLTESLPDSSSSSSFIFDATKPQQACMQPVLMPFLPGNFTEHCLTLNIFTPTNLVPGEKLPVIVFVHGGSFFRWSGNMFNGKRMLERDVVLVTINYRLNLFGFFSLQNEEAPGNIGLYDQILALQWIQKYIGYFKGDPMRVTIAGQSAGGAIVTYLMESPLAKGLFHRVISSSGDSHAGWAVEHNPIRNSLSAATFLGCANGTSPSGQDLDVVLKCMRGLPGQEILKALPHFYSAPTVQDFDPGKIPKIIPHRESNRREGRFNSNVPLMVGINRDDGSFLLSRAYTNFLQAKDLHGNPHYLKHFFVQDLLSSLHFGFSNRTISKLTKSFIGDAIHSGKFGPMSPGLVEIYSKFYFKNAAYGTVSSHSDSGDVYFYSFDFEGSLSLYPYTGGVPQVNRGVAHGDDLMYLFYFGEFNSTVEQTVSNLLVKYWVNFAATGNPNKRCSMGPSMPEIWPKFSRASKHILHVTENPIVESYIDVDWL